MLIGLGIDVARRARKALANRLMLRHSHSHPHDPTHAHTQVASRVRWRPFLMRLVHGLAGSATLVVLAAGTAHEPSLGLAYIHLFGLGSVVGVALVSLAMALPLHYLGRHLPRIATLLGVATGVMSLAIGTIVIANALPGALA